MSSAVRAYLAAAADRFFGDLADWLAVPSVSAEPERAGDVRRCGEWLAEGLRSSGFPVVEMWETEGHPAVFAEWPAGEPHAPTVLLYGHHDVQPAGPLDLWATPPFQPKIRDGYLCARGASDDKGQVWMHVLGVRAHLAASGRGAPAVNLKLLVEGEEEIGSPHLRRLLRRHADRLSCDVVVSADTSMWSADTPTTCVGMRGSAACRVTFLGPSTDIHSGSFGGTVPNPLTELCRVLGALHDDQAQVTIPGFYDRVVPLTTTQRALLAELPFREADWLASAASGVAHGEHGFTTLERVWARPTAEILAVHGGDPGPGPRTIIPAQATATISFRLVADQEPTRIRQAFRAWLQDRVPPGVQARVDDIGDGVRPCLTPLDHPALRAVTAAMSRAFEREIRYTWEGGSGPGADLRDVLDAPVVFLAVCLPTDGYHGPNEKVDMSLLLKGAEAAAYLWSELAERIPR